MPIQYVCVGCREEVFLPDAKSGQLCACPRCRLKFLAPAPNCAVIPPSRRGSVAPRPGVGPSGPPPLFPLEQAPGSRPAARAAARAMPPDRGPPSDPSPRAPAPTPPLEALEELDLDVELEELDELALPEDDEAEDEGELFGVEPDGPALFGEREIEVGELFGGARKPAPSRPAPPAPAPPPPPAAARRGGFRLVALEGLPDATEFPMDGGKVYLMGRDRDAEIKILSTSVSRRQCRIDATSNPPVLIDLGSANGTRVNGAPVDRHPLRQGDLIKMGKVVLRFQNL